MKTIKIFLASSEELEDDRNAFGNLVRKLNKTYEKRGIHLELFEWEDYDAAYNDRRKQDEYNDEVRASDMFLAVFHRVAGKFTIEEFDVATEEFRKKGLPKSYVYCKDLKDGDVESEELKEFKKRLFEELGHYWSRYANRDTMQLHFVMQLQLVESSTRDALKVEDGNVVLDGQPIARMENLPFAGLNEDFQNMSARLAELPIKIEKARAKTEKYPDDEDFQDELQALLNEYNKLKDEFAKYQETLLVFAQQIAQKQSEEITDRMREAVDAFNAGDFRVAVALIPKAKADADQNLKDFRQSKALKEQVDKTYADNRNKLIKSIEELILLAPAKMADLSIPVEDRIAKTEDLYTQADTMAQEVDYEAAKYEGLLWKYGKFLYDYAKYDKAIKVWNRVINLREQLYGKEHPDPASATSYSNIGVVYNRKGDYDKALEYHFKALAIREKVLGKEHPDTATSYNNIGCVYNSKGDYERALEYYFKALEIDEKVLGKDHPDTAGSYNNIGGVYDIKGDYERALDYYFKALEIKKKVLGKEHPDIAGLYGNMGLVYTRLGKYKTALEYLFKALEIEEKVLGKDHSSTAITYNNIGLAYTYLGEYDKALVYYFKALATQEVYGKDHLSTATSYNNIGFVYRKQGDYDRALEYYFKSLAIKEKVLGKDHPDTAGSYNNIGVVYKNKGDYDGALEYYLKALAVFEKKLGENHPYTQQAKDNISLAKEKMNSLAN